MKRIIAILVLIGTYSLCTAQCDYTQEDFSIYKKYISDFYVYKDRPINELAVLTGKYFLGTPYVASTLEKGDKEELVINLRELDCTTFVENVIALSNELKKGDEQSFRGYMNSLQSMRYRGGVIDGYISRIHYTSEWVNQNTKFFHNITLDLGGKTIKKPLSFMSSNPHLYPKLKDNKESIGKMIEAENTLNRKNAYTLLEIANIKEAEKDIRDGDIVIFGTRVSGLDYSHIGLLFWEDDTLKLLHASSVEKKVVVDKKSLEEYCTSSKTCTGITILRLNEN